MKQCFRCLRTLEIEAFYRHPMMADGRLGKCKDCAKADVRANRKARLNYYRGYDLTRWRESPERRAAIFGRARAWAERFPEKTRARNAVANALRDGRLIRPKHCECCGLALRLQGHHDDYSRPLEVRWLCKPCHWKADRRVA